MDSEIEILDLVDENDQIIGAMERGEVYRRGLSNFRVVNALIRNSEGKLFIPRRQKHKHLFPLSLDASVGGHVSSGETYDEAFEKEAREELNLNIHDFPYKILGTMNPQSDGTSSFATIYEIESDEMPRYNPHDFIEHYWLTPEELMKRIQEGDSSKGDLPKIIKRFYLT